MLHSGKEMTYVRTELHEDDLTDTNYFHERSVRTNRDKGDTLIRK